MEGEGEGGGEDGVAEPASACENPTLLRPVRLLTVSRSGLASATRRLDAASRSKWSRESLTIAMRDWD